jgi:hypothetical protein
MISAGGDVTASEFRYHLEQAETAAGFYRRDAPGQIALRGGCRPAVR